MRAGAAEGLGVIAGSDPLPAPGEERYAGSYASLLEGQCDGGCPGASLRDRLSALRGAADPVGRRGGPFEVMGRIRGIKQANRGRLSSGP